MFPTDPNFWSNYFSEPENQMRTLAANAMGAALQNDNLQLYRAAAAEYLAHCLPPMSLPVRFYYVVVTPKGHLVNCLNGGVYDDATVDPPGTVPNGCTNPMPGHRNVAEPNAKL